jgi:hypothetical protein
MKIKGATMKKISLILALLSIASCTSIVKGDRQQVKIDTPNCPSAQCLLKNEQGAYYVHSTPGYININKSATVMTVECEKDGHKEVVTVGSDMDALALGNVLFPLDGFVIGSAVDMGTGAAYKYPKMIINPLSCS